MAVFHGKSGSVTFTPTIVSILSWSMSVVSDVAESTVMAASAWWKSFKAGFIDTSATVECNAMTESVLRVGEDANLSLFVDATKYFAITTAICTEQTETVSKDDVGKISYAFVANDSTGPVYT